MRERQRERERERERQRDRETQRERERQRQRETERQRQTEREREIRMHRSIERKINRYLCMLRHIVGHVPNDDWDKFGSVIFPQCLVPDNSNMYEDAPSGARAKWLD